MTVIKINLDVADDYTLKDIVKILETTLPYMGNNVTVSLDKPVCARCGAFIAWEDKISDGPGEWLHDDADSEVFDENDLAACDERHSHYPAPA